ncbi:MAG: ATP-binding protein [Fimbriimonadales bacterium]|nr:MAG: hypothetical protein KatS3mg018_0105 [Fimbriimonadales bacterium]
MENPFDWLRINPSLFYGKHRLNLIHEVSKGLLRGESYALVGGRRMGKTTFLRRLNEELQRINHLSVSYIDIQTMPSCSDASQALAWLTGEDSIGLSASGIEIVIRTIQAKKKHGYAKVVWLLDEFDSIREFGWHPVFFNNLRSLLHNTQETSGYLTIVAAGSRTMQVLRESPGSPLANVLSWKYLMLLDEEDSYLLVSEPTQNRFPKELCSIVWEKTGGHPFLIQYLMYQVCSSTDEWTRAIELAEQKLWDEHDVIFRQWWFDHLGEDERRVYRSMEDNTLLSAEEINMRTKIGMGKVRDALRVLCYVGLAHKEQNKYKISGTTCQEWICQNDVPEETVFYDRYVSSPTATLRELLSQLEDEIRRFVTSKLVQMERIHELPKIFKSEIEEANRRYKKENSRYEDCSLNEILWYTDFDFPFKVIFRFWKLFYPLFSEKYKYKILGKDKEKAKLRFEERLEVLVRIRNSLAHSRPISQEEAEKGRIFCRDILLCLEGASQQL